MKRILLLSLFIMVVLGFSVAADVPKFQLKPTLTVELVAPKNIKVMESFWVEVYVSSDIKDTIGLTFFELISTPGLEFTGEAKSGDLYTDQYPNKAGFKLENATTFRIINLPLLPLKGKKKLATVELIGTGKGAFNLGLNADISYSQWSPPEFKYVLSTSPITFAVGCVSKLKTCNDFGTILIGDGPAKAYPNCGYLDNGCGTAIKCGECDSNIHCVNNVCMHSEIVLFPPTAEEKELCKTVLTVTSGKPEDTETEINLITGVVSALKTDSFNAKFSGIVTALTAWFNAAK